MEQQARPNVRGWTQIGGSRKFHYFRGPGNSLCDRYLAFRLDPAQVEDSDHDHQENCVVCRKVREKLAQAGVL